MKKSEFKRLLEMVKSDNPNDVILAFELAQVDPIVFRMIRSKSVKFQNIENNNKIWHILTIRSNHLCKAGEIFYFDMDKYLEDD